MASSILGLDDPITTSRQRQYAANLFFVVDNENGPLVHSIRGLSFSEGNQSVRGQAANVA
jgi:hypothetical protein